MSTVPIPQDRAFNGVIDVTVDATNLRRRVMRISQKIPVQSSGPMTLLYPQWEPGSHGPTTEVQRVAGLGIQAGGRRLAWRRDPLAPHAFTVTVPPGVTQVEVAFQYLAPHGSPALITRDMINLQWQHLLLYPAGWFASRVSMRPVIHLPDGFSPASSLKQESRLGRRVSFAPVTLDVLLDSPVLAAAHVQQRVLRDGEQPVRVTYLAGQAEALAGTDAMDAPLRAVITQTESVFGRPPFAAFDFLVPLSDHLPGPGGLEHAHSAEVTLPAAFLADPRASAAVIDLFPHEYAHAWNGKHVQPEGHWTPTPNVPMHNALLWVYEGQTEFWGRVIGARAGLRSVQDTLDALAIDAAAMIHRPGRRWKSLADSALDPVTMPGGRGVSWRDWQRRKDYYPEGVLLWLEVEALLREHSQGRHGLDDFAARFFKVGGSSVRHYSFDDVCETLAGLAPLDWRAHLQQRIHSHEDAGLVDGLARAGYQLSFVETPSDYFRQSEESGGVPDFSYSIGAALNARGVVRHVGWEGPAFRAGLVPGARITQVRGEPFSIDRLVAAVAERSKAGIEITAEIDGQTETLVIDYAGGPRYPVLTRLADRPDWLLPLLAPRSVTASSAPAAAQRSAQRFAQRSAQRSAIRPAEPAKAARLR